MIHGTTFSSFSPFLVELGRFLPQKEPFCKGNPRGKRTGSIEIIFVGKKAEETLDNGLGSLVTGICVHRWLGNQEKSWGEGVYLSSLQQENGTNHFLPNLCFLFSF